MPAYAYRALDAAGRPQRGVLEGDTPRAVRSALRERGLTPIEVEAVSSEQRSKRAVLGPRRAIERGELGILTRQWAVLLRAGLPLDETLSTLGEQSEKRAQAQLLAAVRARVREGQTLADALGEFPRSFPEVFRASIAAGEQSGHLDTVLERLAGYYEGQQEVIGRLGLALIYPVLLLTVAIVVTGLLLAYVVPQVTEVFVGLDRPLPWLTRALMAFSGVLADIWPLLLAALLVLPLLLAWALRRPALRARWDAFLLGLPVVGRLLATVEAARFARTLAIALAAAVPVLEALRVARRVLSRAPLQAALAQVSEEVREGASLAASLGASGRFPPLLVRLVGSGERSGQVEQMLDHGASLLEQRVNTQLAKLLAIVEPLMILIMGAVILTIVLAILLPIFQLNRLIAG
ncbi:MAG: type II secretion system inner membrane protein GspF [Xanthomonadales bacterium]|nr:type II secretion system inner membrane protein GspF [Xanthomonadales bacterium]MCB1634860.1 type II secretion system inner membrane protein GspF [Xanthomonadales bacterium]MCB1641289.1 type II secretion system inner membrane protein GspF [Xanthomonadales bacterium]